MKRYTVRYERDEAKLWVATVLGVAGVHTQGRSLAEARRRIREALALAVGDEEAEKAELVDDVVVPASILAIMKRLQATRKRAETEKAKALAEAAKLAKVLADKLHLSMRDVGELTGVSHQRIHQIAPKKRGSSRSARAG